MFELREIGKCYHGKSGDCWALKGISFSLPSKGLVAIQGKSGSGKSTLLNILSTIESPTEGTVIFNGKELSKFTQREKEDYRNLWCSFVYQHFNLLEDQTSYENVALPLELRGEKEKEIHPKVVSLFAIHHISHLLHKKVRLLSGGEKQRIAILRALISEPKILFADEPTGALDRRNERLVMEELKEISKKILVVLVSHNERLVKEYADITLLLEEGRLIQAPPSSEFSGKIQKATERHCPFSWRSRFFCRNYKKNWLKNLLSIFSGTLGYLSLLIGLGFYAGSESTLEREKSHSLNYLQASLSKQVHYEIEGSPLSLVKSEKPTLEETDALLKDIPSIHQEEDYSYFFPSYHSFSLNGFPYEAMNFVPLWDISLNDRSHSFLVEGDVPKGNSLDYCLVNQEFADKIEENPIGRKIVLRNDVSVQEGDKIDHLSFSFSFLILGIVKEFSFLNSPKIFYSYPALKGLIEREELPNIGGNLESFLKRQTNDSPYHSYASLLYGDERSMEALNDLANALEKDSSDFVISSSAFTISSSFRNLYQAFAGSLAPFLLIEMIGVAFILGSLSYSTFLERRKQTAILMALGARKNDLEFIYESEPFLTSGLSAILALALSYPSSLLASLYLEKEVGIAHLITIPYWRYFGIPFFPIVALLLFAALIAVFSGVLPLHVARRRNVVEELRDE